MVLLGSARFFFFFFFFLHVALNLYEFHFSILELYARLVTCFLKLFLQKKVVVTMSYFIVGFGCSDWDMYFLNNVCNSKGCGAFFYDFRTCTKTNPLLYFSTASMIFNLCLVFGKHYHRLLFWVLLLLLLVPLFRVGSTVGIFFIIANMSQLSYTTNHTLYQRFFMRWWWL